MSRRLLAVLGVLAAAVVVTACVSPGSTTARSRTGHMVARTRTHARATAVGDTAEVVMGTLVAPPTRSFLQRVRSGKMGGVVFLDDWPSRSQLLHVTSELQQAACTRGEPLLLAIDQEGGIVKRLAWAPPTEAPSEMTGPADARSQAAGAAAALRAVGVDVDFAPVVDTPGVPDNFLGSRAFSHSASHNAAMARAFVGGVQQNGVAATAKHFPGLGLAGGNTDNGKIVIGSAAWKLREDLAPFRSAVRAGVKLVMISTAIYPKLDPSGRPAAFSRKIVDGILRQQLGFKGVTVTDSLTAPAPSAISHAATKAMLAGSDLLIWGSESGSEQGYATLRADARASTKLRARLAQAAGRVRTLKAWLAAHGGPGCPAG